MLFTFHRKAGAPITMKLFFLCVLYMRDKVIGYLELAYILWKINGGCSKTSFGTIMDMCCALLNNSVKGRTKYWIIFLYCEYFFCFGLSVKYILRGYKTTRLCSIPSSAAGLKNAAYHTPLMSHVPPKPRLHLCGVSTRTLIPCAKRSLQTKFH